MILPEWLKANNYTEVWLYSTDSRHQTMVDAATYFARYWWDKPREVEVITSGVPDAPGMFFRIKNGLSTYRITYNSPEYKVYRYDKV